jgi:acyl-coenzyme A thioesterase PaaI-like protein
VPEPTDPNADGGPAATTAADVAKGAGLTPDQLERWEDDYLPKMTKDVDPERLAIVTKRLRAAAHTDLSPRRERLRAMADAARLLVARLVATDAPDDVVEAATAQVQATAELLAGYPQAAVYGFSEVSTSGGQTDALFDNSPLIGIANPLAPPMSLVEEDGVVTGTVRFGLAYEGPPGCVHGGYVAATFDEVLGAAQSLSGAPGMTGTLSIRYESPTPLHTDLRFVGWVERVERRKIFTVGQSYAGDRLTATAEGIFISLNPGMFLDLIAERASQPTP